MEVLVFKTNIRLKREVRSMHQHIASYPGVIKWNVDLKDCDKVLRVVSTNVRPAMIETMVKKLGYDCEELKD